MRASWRARRAAATAAVAVAICEACRRVSRASQPLTIGIDARAAIDVPAGRGRVVRELLRALGERDDPHAYRLYTRRPWGSLDERFTWIELAGRGPLWHLRAARLASRECDVFLSCNSNLIVWFTTVPTVPIIHDLVSVDRSLAPSVRQALTRSLTLSVATRRGAAFIAVSQATATDLVGRFPRCAGRTTVALLGPAPALAEPGSVGAGETGASAVGEGFVLAVGTLEPRKNLPRLAEAFRRLPESTQASHPLVVVGAAGWQTQESIAALRGLGDRAQLLGHVSDGELASLYRRCAVFCYPSLGEGFGLPVLEAMAAGAAVVTSDVPALREVGGDAVQYTDPHDVDSIAEALLRVLNDPEYRAALGERGRQRASGFSWATFAATSLRVLEDVAALPRHGRTSAPPADRSAGET